MGRTEIWKDIPGYEGAYQASDLGNIRSLDREIVQRARSGVFFTRTIRGRVLKPGPQKKTGHLSVVLFRGSNGSQVHDLVLRTFKGPRPERADIRHLDGNPANNRLSNLAYGSRTENIIDAYSHSGYRGKLRPEDVIVIRRRLASGERGARIARDFGVTHTQVSRIKKGVTFKWVEACSK